MTRLLKELVYAELSDVPISPDDYQHWLEMALSRLNDCERRAIFLRFSRFLTIAQIADRLKVSWNEADELIDHAVQKIQAVFRTRKAQKYEPKHLGVKNGTNG